MFCECRLFLWLTTIPPNHEKHIEISISVASSLIAVYLTAKYRILKDEVIIHFVKTCIFCMSIINVLLEFSGNWSRFISSIDIALKSLSLSFRWFFGTHPPRNRSVNSTPLTKICMLKVINLDDLDDLCVPSNFSWHQWKKILKTTLNCHL